MIHIGLRKIYKRMEEGELWGQAIVSFKKRVELSNDRDEPVQWRYWLVIDLWIFVLDFEWLSKLKK